MGGIESLAVFAPLRFKVFWSRGPGGKVGREVWKANPRCPLTDWWERQPRDVVTARTFDQHRTHTLLNFYDLHVVRAAAWTVQSRQRVGIFVVSRVHDEAYAIPTTSSVKALGWRYSEKAT